MHIDRWARVLLLVGMVVMTMSGVCAAAVYDAGAAYADGTLQLRVWLPAGVAVVRGAVVLSPGGDGDNRAIIDDPAWQQAATAWQFALVGTCMVGGAHQVAFQGSGDALLQALDQVAHDSGHPELAHVPCCLAGFSNGGAFSQTFNSYRPARVIAFVNNKSGLTKDYDNRAANDTPGLLLYGELEDHSYSTMLPNLFRKHRGQRAPWALAVERGVNHAEGQTAPLIRAFFADAIRLRYPKDASPLHGPVALRPIREADGWVGDNSSWDGLTALIAPYKAFTGVARRQSWLPGEASARAWRALITPPLPTKWTLYTAWPVPAAEARRRQEETAKALGIPRELTLEVAAGVPMRFVLIPAGRFLMGAEPGTQPDPDESPRHEVLITKPFYLGVTDVTAAQYAAVLGKPAPPPAAATLPAVEIAYFEAVPFCAKLTERLHRTARLPSEAEWEYACRAGTDTLFATGNTLRAADANTALAAHGAPVPVGSYPPNAWGLYDMHGNVYQWCADWYGPYGADPQRDPTGPTTGSARVARGGGWMSDPWYCRATARRLVHPWFDRIADLGMRVVIEVK